MATPPYIYNVSFNQSSTQLISPPVSQPGKQYFTIRTGLSQSSDYQLSGGYFLKIVKYFNSVQVTQWNWIIITTTITVESLKLNTGIRSVLRKLNFATSNSDDKTEIDDVRGKDWNSE